MMQEPKRTGPDAGQAGPSAEDNFTVTAPAITLPKGGGAISGIGEKFAANPVTGTGTMTVPVFTSPGRSGFGPKLALSYDSGAGNGPFGFGWRLSPPSITRRTDKGLPKYLDADESDTFILSGAEELVPILVDRDGRLERDAFAWPANAPGYTVQRYRPRIESPFARIERWTDNETSISHWRSISRDNVTTLYGKHEDARIADPADPTRVFTWLICETYDDKGNAVLYRYKPEDDANIERTVSWERNRLKDRDFPQRYVKNILYGNGKPRRAGEDLRRRDDWLFEVVLDYGEHDETMPRTAEVRPWPARPDPFSLFRATFDVRTYRLCRRILMFHHFPEKLGGTIDYLVKSTDLNYKENSVASFVESVMQSGYVQRTDGSYLKKSLPKLEFKYTEVRIDATVRDIDQESLHNLPNGVDGSNYRWIDLDSEGLAGVLTEQADAWYYKRNLGNGALGPVERVAPKPSITALAAGRQQLLDLAGEGRLDLVQYDGPIAGFHGRMAAGGWEPFKPFRSAPNIDTRNPNLRFVDVTGDGFPDILISEDAVFTWYESRAKEGFAPARRTPRSWNEEEGPRLVFADPTESIFLADMAGDGLSDIVRVRHGEVCYWPNLGYGHFGAKVTMGQAPTFEDPDLFDPRRIHLADIDGSGNADIVYVGHDGIILYLNQSGNFWAPPHRLRHFPRTDNLAAVTVTDLLGNGTACLVWSSPLAADAHRPMRYIDLMGGQKPHLLVYSTNNMGAQTKVRYKASTLFYVRDREEGRPWVTKLPFPVHVIERVENRDLVSNTTLVSTYRYRHGYYDGVEREFRGFAYVEQRDAESVVGQFDLPPIVTKTWFHNGVWLEEAKLEAYFKRREFFSGDAEASFLPDSTLPSNLTYDEMREAARALKGGILRQEVYAEDGSPKETLPYSVSERNYAVNCLQPRGPNRYAVFFTHPSETLDYHYERNPADPRITHALTLAVDDYGDVLKSATIGYQRRVPDFEEQKQTLATLTESRYTNPILQDDAYRTPLPAGVKVYELTAPALAGATPLDFGIVDSVAAAAAEIAYEAQPTPRRTQKRLIARQRTAYRKNDLMGLSPFGAVESMALTGESYKLALTPGLLDIFHSKATAADLTSILTGADGGYLDLDRDGSLWIPSGRMFYSPGSGDAPSQELAYANSHFFLPHRFRDPFGNDNVVRYDAAYHLLAVLTRDALGNATSAGHDYRVLQPTIVTDPNHNRVQARFDALGMLAGTAVMGKATGALEGDSFADFEIDLEPADVTAFFDAVDPRAAAVTHLGTATTRIIYDLERVPVCAASIARETHVSDLAPGSSTKVQLSFVYSDAFGRAAQTRIQAEPGALDLADPDAPVADPRWIGSGEKAYNNKGDAVRQYEPFFSATPQFSIEKWGVSRTLFYDPVERVVATLHPNRTFEKIVFDPWRQESWDVNDTVLVADPKTDPDVGDFFRRLPDADYLPTWYAKRQAGALGAEERDAAAKTAIHAATPSIGHADSLGRTFLTIDQNRLMRDGATVEGRFATRFELDILGNQRAVMDADDRIVMRYDYDMLRTRIHQASMEAGERWVLNDVAGKPIRGWDSRDHELRATYDPLRRPTDSFLREGTGPEWLIGRMVYGESRANPEANNLRGKVVQSIDQAGIVTSEDYDFKGNLLSSRRQLAQEYKATLDWSAAPALQQDTFTSATTYDALNRPVTVTTPDQSVYRPTFNEANLLATVHVNLRAAPTATAFVVNLDYDAKGQRVLIEYGNGTRTRYEYDPLTFRLVKLHTHRSSDQALLQDLGYAYDAAGNITHIRDGAQQAIYFDNQVVPPDNDYTYDAVYRLIRATGREHIGQTARPQTTWDDRFRVHLPQPGDGHAMRRYVEEYHYDPVGNFLQLIHHVRSSQPSPFNGNWTRSYAYDEPSLIEQGRRSNRLTGTTVGGIDPATGSYSYDAHGNMTSMPHLTLMQWDFRDQLSSTARQATNDGAPETTYYVYDMGGHRVRKVTERQNGTRKNERIYLGEFERYREYDAGGASVKLERETLHVMDDKRRITLVETRTRGGGEDVPQQLVRYQFGNHLGSASLELDDAGQIISYEEYYPYGSTSYQAGRIAAEVSSKRYRYIGLERDRESGFAYHEARYYAPWLGMWTSCDPAALQNIQSKQFSKALSLYTYGYSNPVSYTDIDGREPKNVTGNIAHAEVLPVLARRINELNTYYQAEAEVNTLLPGSTVRRKGRNPWGIGKIDLVIFSATSGSHVYDLKPWGTSGGAVYERQLVDYVYKLDIPGAAKVGTILEGIAKDNPGVLAPIETARGTYILSLPIDYDTGKVMPGYIEYEFIPREKRKRGAKRKAEAMAPPVSDAPVAAPDTGSNLLQTALTVLSGLVIILETGNLAAVPAPAAAPEPVAEPPPAESPPSAEPPPPEAPAPPASEPVPPEAAAPEEEEGILDMFGDFLDKAASFLPPVPGFIFNSGNSNLGPA
jgi:RHS repeat-associated protein